jgi:antitoxin HicB
MATHEPPLSQQVKTLLIVEMERQDVSKTELARRLKATPQEVTRLCDLTHTTKVDAIQKALKALGKRLTARLVPIE